MKGHIIILTGNEDLRVIKTIESIKKSFTELIVEKPYEKITVKELCTRARINKKTFYHYYETLDALLGEMQQEMIAGFVERIGDYHLPEDMAQVNKEFFLYSIDQGEAYEKITLNSSWQSTRDQMISQVNDVGWGGSAKYRQLSDFEKELLMDFLNGTTLAAYRRWVEDGKKIAIDDVVEILNTLELGGIKEYFKLEK